MDNFTKILLLFFLSISVCLLIALVCLLRDIFILLNSLLYMMFKLLKRIINNLFLAFYAESGYLEVINLENY